MGEKLPDADEFPWSAESATLLEETDKTSIKAVVTTIRKKCEDKACKEAAMQAVTDLATWAAEQKVLWLEPYLITVFEQIMALCADKQRPVQLKAEAAGAALMKSLNPLAVDGMMPLLFKQFEEHRWQTKLGAVTMFRDLAKNAPKVGAHAVSEPTDSLDGHTCAPADWLSCLLLSSQPCL